MNVIDLFKPHQETTMNVQKMSIAERILLAEELWDSVAAETEAMLPLTEAQMEELNTRLTAYLAGDTKLYSFDDIKTEIANEYQ